MSPRASWERWLPLAFVALAFALLAPLFVHPLRYADKSDWRYFQTMTEVARRSVVWFHQWPLWNPWACGGEVAWANPQSEASAPTFLLALVFGTALGMKLALVVYVACAGDGMYRLCRQCAIAPLGALVAALLFAGGGWLMLHTLVGHTNFASVGLFPYLVLFYVRALDRRVYVIAVGAIAAWIVALGGTSTPAMAIVLLVTLACCDAIARHSLVPFRVLALSALCAVGLGAYRLFPALEFALAHPRRQWQTDSSSLWQLIAAGYRWKGDDRLPGKLYRYHEYGWRLAYVTPPLILWSVAIRGQRRFWILVLVGLAIAAGAAIPHGPWWLLKQLPVFRDLRVPSRYTVLLAFALPLLCGAAAADLLTRVSRPRLRRALAALLLVAIAADGVAFAWARLRIIGFPAMAQARRGQPFYQTEGDWSSMFDGVIAGRGVIACMEEAPLERAQALRVGPAPQAWLDDERAGTLVDERWSPNRLHFTVALTAPATLVINENWNEHWTTDRGTIVKYGPKHPADRDGGQLAVALPAGDAQFTVAYRPRSFAIGWLVTLLSIVLLGVYLLRSRRRGEA